MTELSEKKLVIREASIEELVRVNGQIEEFGDPYPIAELRRRLDGRTHLGLVAELDSIVGFKVGYELEKGVFYSWLGGVLRNARGHGVAQALLDAQEAWAVEQGYDEIKVKSRNTHAAMLRLLLRNDYLITDVVPQDDPMQNRIWFSKKLARP